jgi:hypothetical protein
MILRAKFRNGDMQVEEKIESVIYDCNLKQYKVQYRNGSIKTIDEKVVPVLELFTDDGTEIKLKD